MVIHGCNYYWLASSGAESNNYLFKVSYAGNVERGHYGDETRGVRPVVSLDSGIAVDATDT